ncbi:FAD-dependent oxidoreductase, partial [bacterium]|nr:FAD-dependent oxidoreductase [bacterium]
MLGASPDHRSRRRIRDFAAVAYRRLEPAPLAFSADGTPWSPTFGDIYHSSDGGLEQARHVFLGGNHLPQAWQDRERFVILETGFGLGLNFLATWQAWRDDPQRCGQLHFVSVEQHPFRRDDLVQLQGRWPELAPFAAELAAAWPPLTPGFHRLAFEDGHVILHLLLGPAEDLIPAWPGRYNALYLDGFAPAKNPAMWHPRLLNAVSRHAGSDATLATWSVSLPVREALSGAGWLLEKRPGFGRKHEMLTGHRRPMAPGQRRSGRYSHLDAAASEPPARRHAFVIGAGLAGCAIAERLAARGWQVDLIERHAEPAQEASGNRAGLLHPMLSRDDNLASRLSRACHLFSLRLLRQVDGEDRGLLWGHSGILQLARDAAQEQEPKEAWEAL